jgi:hypothetical protein
MMHNPAPTTARECAARLRMSAAVVAVDVIEADERFADDRTSVEVALTDDYERVPPHVLRILGEYDLGLWPPGCGVRPDHYVVVAV